MAPHSPDDTRPIFPRRHPVVTCVDCVSVSEPLRLGISRCWNTGQSALSLKSVVAHWLTLHLAIYSISKFTHPKDNLSLNPCQRPLANVLRARLAKPRRLIQFVGGPRQVGKTTLVQQVLSSVKTPSLFLSADEPAGRDAGWIARQWERARELTTAPIVTPRPVVWPSRLRKRSGSSRPLNIQDALRPD